MRNLAAVAVLVGGLLLAREHGAILVAALALAWLLAGRTSTSAVGGRYVTGHAHGERTFIARHEGGHAVAATAVGGQVTSAWMTDDEGLVQARIPDDPVKVVGFLAAGRAAVNSGRGCSADNAEIRKELRSVPSKVRGQVKRDGIRLARQITSSRAGEIRRFAAELNEKGRL